MKSRENNSAETPALAPAPAPSPLTKRVLVVNDESDARQLIVEVMTKLGYEVESAEDGAKGWDALHTGRYGLVITDNKMPRMTGLEMIEKLRAANMSVPVVMATGHLPKLELSRKPWLQPEGMLERPYSNDDLLEVVDRVLRMDEGFNGGRA